MIVGVLRIELVVYESHSLKDKRSVIKGLKSRLAERFNVSIAEVGALDSRQQAVLGVAVVGSDTAFVHSNLDKVIDFVRRQGRASLVKYERELYY
ncbi:MAG: DUF503 domain-containing protein [Phycisphaerae bacterium]